MDPLSDLRVVAGSGDRRHVVEDPWRQRNDPVGEGRIGRLQLHPATVQAAPEPSARTIWPLTRESRVSLFAPSERRRGVAMTIGTEGRIDLGEHGIDAGGRVHLHPSTSILYTHTLRRDEGRLAEGGPIVVDTGRHTGRSPMDKFIVREPGSKERIWWSTVNQELDEGHFEGLRDKVTSFLEHQDLYVVDSFAAADPAHRVGVRLITYSPWHALFAKTLFIDPTEEELAEFEPDAVIFHAPIIEAEPEDDGTRSSTFVVLHPTRGEILIGGTFYAGEIKKSVFTL